MLSGSLALRSNAEVAIANFAFGRFGCQAEGTSQGRVGLLHCASGDNRGGRASEWVENRLPGLGTHCEHRVSDPNIGALRTSLRPSSS